MKLKMYFLLASFQPFESEAGGVQISHSVDGSRPVSSKAVLVGELGPSWDSPFRSLVKADLNCWKQLNTSSF